MFEQLENRTLMSASPLTVNGTSGNDTIAVKLVGTSLKVTVNGQTTSHTTSSVSQLVINAKAGNDTVTLDSSVKTPAIIKGGDGNDALTGGSGNDMIYGGAGNDTCKGG